MAFRCALWVAQLRDISTQPQEGVRCYHFMRLLAKRQPIVS